MTLAAAVQEPSRVRALLQSIPSLRGLDLRRGAIRRHLRTWSATELAIVVERTARLAARRDGRAQETSLALGLGLAELYARAGEDAVDAARDFARTEQLPIAAMLLARPAARRAVSRHARPADFGRSTRRFASRAAVWRDADRVPHEGPVPWCAHYDVAAIAAMDADELDRWAVSPPRRELERWTPAQRRSLNAARLDAYVLLTDPTRVRQLLALDWVNEADVLRIATRRPIRPGIVRVILEADRWIVSDRVQHAVLTNPFTPPSIVLPLLPAATGRTLKHLAETDTADPSVAEAARRIFGLSFAPRAP
ncbi:MAG: hypothetical protein RIT81_42480 [Deltaproteobacteria bacterium]